MGYSNPIFPCQFTDKFEIESPLSKITRSASPNHLCRLPTLKMPVPFGADLHPVGTVQ